MRSSRIPLTAVVLTAGFAAAHEEVKVDSVVVEAPVESELGSEVAASAGKVGTEQLRSKPTYRPGELLEASPGLIITQHSGEGKANQYFLRGVNLDHGTDLRTTVAGMPVNQRSHGHGQGYADLNFLIPELVAGLEYRKGPYYAEKGDFSSAGAVDLTYFGRLPTGIASLGLGEDDFQRALIAGSPRVGDGDFLYGLEYLHNDGPWTNPDDFRKINAALGYNHGSAGDGFSVLALAYDSRGDATNQIARRAVDSGLTGRFDSLDESDGSDSSRYSLSGTWRKSGANFATTASAYVIKSELDLFSNFTYFLDDPVNGDQFLQVDDRATSGFDLTHSRIASWGGRTFENTFGLQFQNDNIANGLFSTGDRQVLSTTRADDIVETSIGAYSSSRIHWAEKFHTVVGVRGDVFNADVDSDNAVNSGKARPGLINPKLSLIFGPYAETEYFVNAGGGFHSNDARGATIAIDPATGDPADRVPLLVRSWGYELGLRSTRIPNLVTSAAVFLLDFDSELVFVGDAGTTEASRPSRRIGFELSALYRPLSWLAFDTDLAYASARFRDDDPAGDRIPGAVEGVASLSAIVDNLGPWFGTLQLRFFGPRPLIEDDSVRSGPTTLVSGRIGYQFTKRLRFLIEGFNLLDEDDSQIDYFYTSRLAGEPADGVDDIHFHPVEPRTFRAALILDF